MPWAFTYVSVGEAELQQGRFEQSEIAFREAAQIARRIGDWQQLARSLYRIGRFRFFEDNYDGAYQLWTEALAIYTRHNQHVDCGLMEYWLSLAAGRLGHFHEARQHAADCVASHGRYGWPELANHAAAYLADIDTYLAERPDSGRDGC